MTSEVNATHSAALETIDTIDIRANAEDASCSQDVSSLEPDTIPASGTVEAVSLSTTGIAISKKAQKKAAKQAYFAEKKLERRAREKEAKKEKKRVRRERQERIAAGEVVSEDDEEGGAQPERKKARRVGPTRPFNARVVLDLGFDDMMSDKEVVSLCSQLAYTYNANKKSRCPFKSLLFTSLDKRTRTRLDSLSDASYKRWTNTEWWAQGYDRLWSEADADVIAGAQGKSRSSSEKDKVIYLTADADDELAELKEGETYIIGGICDHNRYKNLCRNKATECGIRSARLPIGRYLTEMTSRKVLTVNQVFEILVHWTESRNWEEALYSVVPKRKFEQGKNKRSQSTTMTPATDNQENAGLELDSDALEAGEKAVADVGQEDSATPSNVQITS